MQKLFYLKSIVMFGLSSKPLNIPRLSLENSLRYNEVVMTLLEHHKRIAKELYEKYEYLVGVLIILRY